jgi:hypothetical protein
MGNNKLVFWKIVGVFVLLFVFVWIVFAIWTWMQVRGSSMLPWQGVSNWYYLSWHHVWSGYQAENRFSFVWSNFWPYYTWVVYDSVTGLYWQADGSYSGTFNSAVSYCNTLSFSWNWSLPNIKELMSIVDYSTSRPAYDTHYFTGRADNYRSSTSAGKGWTGMVYIWSFGYWTTSYTSITNTESYCNNRRECYLIRCVLIN